MLKIEVETENFAQLEEALEAGADIIMLDNMSIEDMKQAVSMIGGRALVEASGNMGEKTCLLWRKQGWISSQWAR
jgi:nicotinate-nucleotide pyrophosphorylase (carboxylating)